MKGSTIGSILLIVFGVGIILLGKFGGLAMLGCSGWGWINPICWGKGILNISLFIIMFIIGLLFIIGGIIGFFNPSAMKWYVLFIVFSIILVLDIFIPDPIPIIDEAILAMGSLLAGMKTLTASGANVKEIGF